MLCIILYSERGEKAIRIFLQQGVLIKKRLKDKLHRLARRARARTLIREESKLAQVTDVRPASSNKVAQVYF